MKRAWNALLLSLAVTVFLTLSAWMLGELGWASIARALVWPASLIQSFVPLLNIGTESQPFYEATPVHVFAFLVGLAAQIPIYWLAFYGALRFARRKCT